MNTLMAPARLSTWIFNPNNKDKPRILDCRFELGQPRAGRQAHKKHGIVGSLYADLEQDLSGPTTTPDGQFLGRHPLPDRSELARKLGSWGITPGTSVVVYDAGDGMLASRAWWLFRWMGHERVWVLDGGYAQWLREGHSISRPFIHGRPVPAPPYPERTPLETTISLDEVQTRLGQLCLVDARAPERFQGLVEPLDKAAGHIPGAINRFFKQNLQENGLFKDPAELRQAFTELLSQHGFPPEDERTPLHLVQQCGSGVSACHNILAMRHAGLYPGRLFPGSWSQWCHDGSRPVARQLPQPANPPA
jgi:thiosulfate/3-mercaptopyruvate sulfurtransferase